MALKCSLRRIQLQQAQTLLSSLIQANEMALQLYTTLTAVNQPADITDEANTSTLILDAVKYTGTGASNDTVSDELARLIVGLDWVWQAEA